MIEIALGKWGYYFYQIIFNANKMTFLWKLVLLFPGSYYIKSYHTQVLPSALLGLDPNQNIS